MPVAVDIHVLGTIARHQRSDGSSLGEDTIKRAFMEGDPAALAEAEAAINAGWDLSATPSGQSKARQQAVTDQVETMLANNNKLRPSERRYVERGLGRARTPWDFLRLVTDKRVLNALTSNQHQHPGWTLAPLFLH